LNLSWSRFHSQLHGDVPVFVLVFGIPFFNLKRRLASEARQAEGLLLWVGAGAVPCRPMACIRRWMQLRLMRLPNALLMMTTMRLLP